MQKLVRRTNKKHSFQYAYPCCGKLAPAAPLTAAAVAAVTALPKMQIKHVCFRCDHDVGCINETILNKA